MAAEAEATDILVKMSMTGAEHLIRITGEAATNILAHLIAFLKSTNEKLKGKQKLGGKINTRAFVTSFISSSIIPLSKAELKTLKPELKRLHIPYMQYHSTTDMHSDRKVEISVRKEDIDRFIRVAEQHGIAIVEPYDGKIEELSPAAYEEALKNSGAANVNVEVTEDGVTILENENPSQAPVDPSHPSEPNSGASNSSTVETTAPQAPVQNGLAPGEPFVFNEQAGVDKNLITARSRASAFIKTAREDGRFIPISINKETLFQSLDGNNLTVFIPGTQRDQSLVIPKCDIVTMEADAGHTIRVDLRPDHPYTIRDNAGRNLETVTGLEIKNSGSWDKVMKKAPAVKAPQVGRKR